MSIAKITVDRKIGRFFLKRVGAKLDLEFIDLVKTINIEPSPLTEEESQTISLSDKYTQLTDAIQSLSLTTKYQKVNLERSSLQDINTDAEKLYNQVNPVIEEIELLKDQEQYLKEVEMAVKSLEAIQGLDIHDVQDFGAGTHFYAVLGYLKGIHKFRLEMSLDQLTGGEFIYKPVSEDKTRAICLIGVMKKYQAPLDRLLSGLGFELIIFPSKITGPPEKALYKANNLLNDTQTEYDEFKDRIMNDLTEELNAIQAMAEQLKLEYDRLILLQRSQLKHDKYIIWAWFPRRQAQKLTKIVEEIDSSITLNVIKNPELEDHEFPSIIRNNRYSRNYENLVHGFGTPGYNEWDPTKILSILIPIFFGIMFGDVFDGLVVFLIGLYGLSLKPSKYSKNSMLAELQTYFDKGGPVLVTMGLSAMFFGFLFGSYRGLGGHHALEVGFPILWFSPEIAGGQFALLELALFLGFLVISFALIMQFLGRLGHNKNEAIFLPGMFLLFYIGLIFLIFTFGPNPTLWLTATEGKFDLKALQTIAHSQQEYMHHHHIDFVSPIGELLHSLNAADWGIPVFAVPGLNMSYPLALVIFPLLFSAVYHFRHGMDGIGELLDYAITMISNTISFARIFAYNIVHGSLSLVFIQVLAGSGHGLSAYLPGMIVGGFIVIPLELLVSFLQSLRLCWVEFFGKLHYQGTGHKFFPFKEKRLFTTVTS